MGGGKEEKEANNNSNKNFYAFLANNMLQWFLIAKKGESISGSKHIFVHGPISGGLSKIAYGPAKKDSLKITEVYDAWRQRIETTSFVYLQVKK